jgi:hypothetical protein
MEQLPAICNGMRRTSSDRIRVGGKKAGTGSRTALPGNTTTPLKPKEGLNGPPADSERDAACPTTITVGPGIVEPLAPFVPGTRTGLGSYFPMTVGPPGTDYVGTPIMEALTETFNNCGLADQCAADARGFVVGRADTMFNGGPAPSTRNVIWDQHITVARLSVADCHIDCSQTYYCGHRAIGSFMISRHFSQGTVGTTTVTNVTVTKVPQ